MQVLHMHCGGGKGAVILVPPAAGASHNVPAKSTWLMQTRAEWSCQMTINLWWNTSVDKSQASDKRIGRICPVSLHGGELGSV